MKRTLKTISIWVGTLCFILIVFPGAFAQSSLNTLGGNTNDAGGSVNFSLGQLFYQTNSGTTGSAAEGVQHPFELIGSSVPATYILLDRVIGTGELLCFDARQSITVAGGEGSVVIQPNAVVDFIAGQSIRFLPGFYAQAGSWVSARITTTGTFCGQPIAPVVMQTENPPEKTVESINPDPFAP
ncbi:MAG TPA: hypothetical protein PLK12_17070 [Prolixibacteraceae bacterium]|nr:hypothetical protein [Prolixibacteraceae bacterium]